ncbi:MAG: site-specific integrase [Candidatus Pacebacteria bacterium]|nr:site-specific integrase [Candidatus Paceibacterota bacterium]
MSKKLQGEYLVSLAQNCVQDYVESQRPELTIKNLRNFLRRFLTWVGDRELTPLLCRKYTKYMQVEKKLAHSSVSSDTRRIKMFLYYLRYVANNGEGVIDRDWAKEVHSPRKYGMKEKAPEQLLSPEKMMEYVLKVTEPGKNDNSYHRKRKAEYRAFLLFYMKMGLRPNEAIKIDPKRVNIDGNPPSVQIWRGKNNDGGEWRPIGLPLDYLEPIRERVEQGRWFDVSQNTLQKYMRDISKIAGRKVTLYSIRKSVDTFSIDAGAPLMKLAIHQGHTVQTMQRDYVKFSAKESSEVNNTYNPWIDRSKLPAKFLMPKIESLVKEIKNHPNFKVVLNENKLEISWK